MIGTNRIKADEEIAASAVKAFKATKPQLDELSGHLCLQGAGRIIAS